MTAVICVATWFVAAMFRVTACLMAATTLVTLITTTTMVTTVIVTAPTASSVSFIDRAITFITNSRCIAITYILLGTHWHCASACEETKPEDEFPH